MFITIGKPSKLEEIKKLNIDKKTARSTIPICVIDDEPFLVLDNLRNHGYSISELGDISDIKQVSEFDVVICDIRGVGKNFGSKYEGGHLIKEIKTRYPSKFLIAYSGSRFDPAFRKFLDYSDFSINKDIDLDDWVNTLDVAIDSLIDPFQRWIRIREHLLNDGVDLFQLLLIEQSYIKAIKNKKPEEISKLIGNIDPLGNNDKVNVESLENLAIFLTKLVSAGITASM